jgi:hypothetical protein
MDLQAGQRWTYRVAQGYDASRLIIGAIVKFEAAPSIICCSVTEAPRSSESVGSGTVSIPFLPLSETAFRNTAVALDGMGEPPASFSDRLQEWSDDPNGLTVFMVPFDGHLDRLIAYQMAEIVKKGAA